MIMFQSHETLKIFNYMKIMYQNLVFGSLKFSDQSLKS